MTTQEVLERFAIIANLTSEEITPWTALCEDAENEIRSHLREDTDEEEHSRRLSSAAAALAFYRYMMYRTSVGNVESFSAGELKIKTDAKTAVQLAHNIWRDARNAVCDLLNDEDFVFERIESRGHHCKRSHC